VKQWSAAVGQPHPPNAAFPTPHSLAQVSLSVSPDGTKALYNSLEGLTTLWNLDNGEIIGTFESFVRTKADSEPGKESASSHPRNYCHLSSTAWSVSLNPRGDTYASTGGSGNVSIHSAQTDNFGERLSTISSGRNKFGMFCSYVRGILLFIETIQE